MFRIPLVLVFTAVFTPIAANAAAWQFAKPKVPFSQTPGVVYGAGRWVGVGPAGKIITSTNGIDWSTGPILTREDLLDVSYAAGRFVACGGNGTLLTSVDGLSWEHRTTGNEAELRDVIHAGGLWVFTGKILNAQAPLIFSSSDLSTWNIFDTEGKYQTGGSSAEAFTVMHGGGKFLVPMPNKQSFVSTNGIDWTREPNNLNFSFPKASTYDSGKFYCIDYYGQLASSPDGANWTNLPFPNNPYNDASDLFVEGNRMIITTERSFHTSTNGGATWTQRWIFSDANGSPECSGIAKGNGAYLVMAYDGSAIRSTDFNWQTEYAGANADNFADVAHGGGNFLAVGSYDDNSPYGVIWSSPDGIAWTKRRQEGPELFGACYGNGTWVCVGETILSSTNLSAWTTRTNPSTLELRDVTFANGLFVAVGGYYDQSLVLTSPDGITWTQRSNTARGPLTKVIHANGLFVAVASWNSIYKGDIISSPDGINWTRCPLDIDSNLTCIAYGNSMFVAGGDYEYALKSTNGVDWTIVDEGHPTSYYGWSDLIFDGTRFIGCSPWMTRSSVYTTDGAEWSNELMGSKLKAMVAAEGKIVAVGPGNHIITRAIGASPAAPATSADGPIVSWTPVAGAAGYQVYKRLAGTKRWDDAAITQPAAASSVFVRKLKANTAYDFAVQAIMPQGLSQAGMSSATTFGPLDMWMLDRFGTRANSGGSADSADPDGDGQANLMEYFRGSDPKKFESRFSPPQSATIQKTIYNTYQVRLSFSFPLDSAMTDTTCYLEESTDLVNWTRVAESVGGQRMTVLEGASGWATSDAYVHGSSAPRRSVLADKTATLPLPSGAGRVYGRLGVERRQP
ncbi:fibronectin type III domain-containing protein [Luteolibacter sp. GHJ8]|uniref:Fibronectin type III domain-containing protein n=1 Tax=Luteolibacter rhizosphaerae TaxID=2989719 RepID=A0ABT3G3S9_9BACT|nr:fibronectin type III domain-containing protein [Luteolibacter rhizosphaerae]MCW1914500.1 fibronectin type III domain-containing protein [Luteolibacter rhizosphaerae]